MTETSLDRKAIIQKLQLEPHVEGGYFRRTFASGHWLKVEPDAGKRTAMSSIYYLLTADSPVGHWHLNRSDIVHFYHLGSPVHYSMIYPDGSLETAILGPDLVGGQQLQLLVEGGVWKASHLPSGDYGLVSEAVSPGFDYTDMTLGERDYLTSEYPHHRRLIEAYTR